MAPFSYPMRDLSQSIRHHAASRPGGIALRQAQAILTYSELDFEANRLASYLRSSHAMDGAAVAVCYPRSIEQIIALLGVMRAGGAYIPIDPAWPRERIRFVLKDSNAIALIALPDFAELAPESAAVLSPGQVREASVEAADVCEALPGESLAYVIYTSGSTGTPKGVEITHGNLEHLIAWHLEEFGVTPQDRASHLAGLGFDASVWEVWPYLAAGACVSLADDMVRTAPALLQAWLVEEAITMAFVPTPLAEPMILMEWPEETTLRFLLTGGDCLHHGPEAGLPFVTVNNYGPTECSVVATSGVVLAGEEGLPTIGRQIKGTLVYVLGDDGREAATGEMGELYIGGSGVGRGYRGQAEQTARAFVNDPRPGGTNGRMYRTGDFARVLPDGQIAFCGRVDGQVKIRGQRLELAEIVCALNRHAGVAFSTVVAAGEGEEKHLVGYVLPDESAAPTANELQDFLRESLPIYMIPTAFVRLQTLPLSANGKVDTDALPQPSQQNRLPETAFRGPSSPVEEAILKIVRTLLKIEDVGVDDDFFLIGGHSLMGTRLVMRLRETFGVRVTLKDLFEAGTVALLAEQVEALLIQELHLMSEEEAASQVME